ncbi:MAG: hypothetical protein ACFFAJ_04885 [Candidatus Hodarchaeota archaeon]
MAVPKHSERKLSLISDSDLIIQSSLSMQIRGSNFQKEPATIFIDKSQGHWLWKDQAITSLTREFVVSFLASQLDISIPRSIIAKKGRSLGLIQEWISNGKELQSFSNSQMNCNNKGRILELIIFETWIGALDRHGGNYLISEGEVWAIDFEESFGLETNGSELYLYFPWIKEANEELVDIIKDFKSKIRNRRLLKKETLFEQFSTLLKILKDPRAKVALHNQLNHIYDLLNENYLHLEKLVSSHLHQNRVSLELTLHNRKSR